MGSLHDRYRSILPQWLVLLHERSREGPLELVRGEGRHVWDADGRRYLDFFGGILTTMTGHAVPEVVEAIREQAGRIVHTSTLYMSEPTVTLAEQIAALVPQIPDARVFFVNSGSEANEAALLLATAHRRSNQVLALRNGYHGRSFATVSVTGNRAWSVTTNSGLAVGWLHNGDRLRGALAGLSTEEVVRRCTDDLRVALATTTAPGVACLIAEPIQGVGGFHVLPDGLLRAYREILAEDGVLLIADEVQTGWGRTGSHFWGFEAHGVTPDIVTFAKGVANGLPLAGVIARADVMASIQGLSISTFGGGTVAAAAASANIGYLLEHDLQANAASVGARLAELLQPALAHAAVADLRGRGLMLALELVDPDGTDGPLTPAPALSAAIADRCRSNGLLLGSGGLYGNVIRVAPPLSVTPDEVDEAALILLEAIDALCG